MKTGVLCVLAGVVGVVAGWGCAEPFDRPIEPEPTLKSEDKAAESRADLGVAADAGAAKKAEVSGYTPKPEADEDGEPDEYEVELETKGDVLSLEGETPKVLAGARVSVLCSGTQKNREALLEAVCSSTLRVHTGKGKSAQLVAETKDAPEQSKFRADGGERETTLALDLFALIKKPRASLIRIRSTSETKESISETSEVVDTFYLLNAGKLVQVLQYTASGSSSVDTDPPHNVADTQEATLSIDKKLTRGLPDLVVREVAVDSKNGRQNKRKTTTRYVWNGEVYDACAPKLDTVQHCGACGHACKKGEGCCDKRCMPLDTAEHCGACDNICKASGQGDAPRCADPTKKRCEIACVGDHYDVDGDAKNGCEKQLEPAGHHSEATALDRGDKSCGDSASRDEMRGELASDRRVHDGVAEWNARTRSVPTYVRVRAQGGLCQNDLFAALRIEGGTPGKRCYRLTARTDRGQRSVDVASGDEAIIQSGRGAYSSGSSVLFKVHKLCAQPESVRFALRYHL